MSEKNNEGKPDFDFGAPVPSVQASQSGASQSAVATPVAPATTPTASSSQQTDAVAVTNAPKKRGRKPKNQSVSNVSGPINTASSSNPSAPAVEERPKDARTEFLDTIKNKAGIETIPTIEALFAGRENAPNMIPIRDISVFIGEATQQDGDLLKALRKTWSATNTIHQSAEISMKNVVNVATQLLNAGRAYMSIEVARLPDGTLQCWSGRHRLVALALIYGLDVKVPVSISNYDLVQAKDAVIVANQARRQQTLEKAEHRILRTVHGDSETEREEIYRKAVTKKSQIAEFCLFSVFTMHEYGTKLTFPVSSDNTRANGLTTINGLKGFWKRAISWDTTMSRKEFDHQLRDSVSFMNTLVEAMQSMKGFDPKQHLASMTLVAIGGIYAHLRDAQKTPSDSAKKIARGLVDMGEIARQKSEKTYKDLLKVING